MLIDIRTSAGSCSATPIVKVGIDGPLIQNYITIMIVFAAILKLLRCAMVIAVAAMLAFGALAGPLSAQQHEHESAMSLDDIVEHDYHEARAACPSNHTSDMHDSADGSCCIGTCTTILGVASRVDVPTGRLTSIDPFYLAMAPRHAAISFIRPPSLTI
jgi:hypothetical protein